uniref:Probable molybdenum cofactor guanylyltransferase n=1 Tax=uncultured Armatimonadetes bacterium TaxID=157466 RepID=A0A6J4HEN2_9BACT|nr:Molybdenum cofactor guanylyltransferase [uncultured Armatimonadetes bacterium]
MQTTVAILAGGLSRRMGQDKAVLVLNGRTLLERAARTAHDVAPSVLVVGRDRPPGWPIPDTRFVPDDLTDVGPLGGLATALRSAGGDDVLAVACDMPRLTPSALRWLFEQAVTRSPESHGVAVLNEGRVEPLFSVYAAACLPLIESQLAAGRRSLHALITAGRFEQAEAPPDICAALVNVNTPEEWAGIVER